MQDATWLAFTHPLQELLVERGWESGDRTAVAAVKVAGIASFVSAGVRATGG